MPIKSSFDHLEKCARTAEHSRRFKAERNRVFEKSARCNNFAPLVRATSRLSRCDFGNAEIGQILRDQCEYDFSAETA